MITIQKKDNLVIVAVIGEFTLADYNEFEQQVLYQSHFEGEASLLFDWRDMLDYTVDVAEHNCCVCSIKALPLGYGTFWVDNSVF